MKLLSLLLIPALAFAQDACTTQKQQYQNCKAQAAPQRLALSERFNQIYQQCGMEQCYQELRASTTCNSQAMSNYKQAKLLCSTLTTTATAAPLIVGRKKREAEETLDRVKRHGGGGRGGGFFGDFGGRGGRGRRYAPSCGSTTPAQLNCTLAARTALYQDQTFIQARNSYNLAMTECRNLLTIPRWQCRNNNNFNNDQYCNCHCTAHNTRDQEFFTCYQQALPTTTLTAPTARDCTGGCTNFFGGRRGRGGGGGGFDFRGGRGSYDYHGRGGGLF